MKRSVLVVDDETVFRNYIRQMELWENSELYIAAEARSAQEALRILERQEINIVILDVSMPGKNGVFLSEIIAAKYPQTAMIAVSSYDDYDYVRQILKNGAHDYILKSRLTEETLLRALESADLRMRQRSPWEIRKELRSQAAEWIFHGAASPFTSDNSRKAAAIAQIRFLKSYSGESLKTLTDGIGRVLESGGSREDGLDILAIPCGSDKFVLIYRFYEETSEARMQERIAAVNLDSQDAIRRLYSLQVTVRTCPAFFSDNAMRSYLQFQLKEKEEETAAASPLAMTIGQQKKLLAAVETLDGKDAGRQVRSLYEQIPPGQEALCLMVTKEMLDLLVRISEEYRISLDFLPQNNRLFEYTQGKSRETLAANVSGLYENVLREIREREETGQYSSLVKKAIALMEQRYGEPVGLKDIAGTIGTNSSYLSRLFHEETGTTVTDYLNRVRVEQSKKLLEEDVPLKEIVCRCGFRSYGYFLKIFKEYTGKTPKEFLKGGE
ncbi:MAG TPA: response regulator [Candidatus Eisenbergiella intestinipullorum]|nr:response regulator [Candidatus Eisenbergiella intestinipullorum]